MRHIELFQFKFHYGGLSKSVKNALCLYVYSSCSHDKLFLQILPFEFFASPLIPILINCINDRAHFLFVCVTTELALFLRFVLKYVMERRKSQLSVITLVRNN